MEIQGGRGGSFILMVGKTNSLRGGGANQFQEGVSIFMWIFFVVD